MKPWIGTPGWIALPILAALAISAEVFIFRRDSDFAAWGALRLFAITATCWLGFLIVRRNYSRMKIVTLQGGELIVQEIAPLRPLRQQWPMPAIRAFELCAQHDGKVALLALLTDDTRQVLLANEAPQDLQFLRESLQYFWTNHVAPTNPAARGDVILDTTNSVKSDAVETNFHAPHP
jgi:hypothetical protein